MASLPSLSDLIGLFESPVLLDEEGLLNLSEALADCSLRSPLNPLVVSLVGPLGAGKSTFARGVLRALGFEGPFQSPSYPLLIPYEREDLEVYHWDFYRLEGGVHAELPLETLTEEAPVRRIHLLEWAERIRPALPPSMIEVRLEPAGRMDLRYVSLHARGDSPEGSAVL